VGRRRQAVRIFNHHPILARGLRAGQFPIERRDSRGNIGAEVRSADPAARATA
jgi:hypothetical protein